METYDEYKIDEPIEVLSDEELLSAFSGDNFEMYMKEIKRYPVADNESNMKYYKAYCNGDLKARDMLINTNLKLVVSVANRYKKYFFNLQLLDIIQEGNSGLINAVENYDPTRGAFSTCAVVYIEQAIIDALHYKEKMVRASVNLQTKLHNYYKLLNEYDNEEKKIPEHEELCQYLNVSEKRLIDIIEAANMSVVSLNKLIDNNEGDNDTEFGDLLEDPKSDMALRFINESVNHDLYAVLREILTPVQYYVIYYHILIDEKIALVDIGKKIGITRERVRLIEANAKEIIERYLPTDSRLFMSVLKRIKKREGSKFSIIKHEPVLITRIIDFLYVKSDLTLREQEYFRLKYLSNYNYSESDIVKLLNMERNEYLEFKKNLNEKISNLLADVVKFRDFKKHVINTYKTEILTLYETDKKIKYVIDVPYLKKKYASASYDEILMTYSNVWEILLDDEKKLLYNFFVIPKSKGISGDILNRETNLAMAQYSNQQDSDNFQESKHFDLKMATKDDVIAIVKKYDERILKLWVRDELMAIFKISFRIFMSEQEINDVWQILDKLENKKIEFESDEVKKLKKV